jgi:integrase/recombinase XerC
VFGRKQDSDWIETYLAELETLGRSEATLRSYKGNLTRWRQSGLDPKTYLYQLPDQGHKPGTVNLARAILHGYYAWLYQNHLHKGENPLTRTRTIKTPRRLKTVLTVSEVARLIDACDSLGRRRFYDDENGWPIEAYRARLAAMIAMQVTAGLRVSELCKIRVESMDAEHRRVTVIRKGDKEQTLRYGKVAARKLTDWDLTRPLIGSTYLFCTPSGAHIPTRTYTRHLAEACYWAEISPITPHALRRTFATLAVDSGIPIRDVQEMLGHAHVTTTELYVQRGAEQVWKRYDEHVLEVEA